MGLCIRIVHRLSRGRPAYPSTFGIRNKDTDAHCPLLRASYHLCHSGNIRLPVSSVMMMAATGQAFADSIMVSGVS